MLNQIIYVVRNVEQIGSIAQPRLDRIEYFPKENEVQILFDDCTMCYRFDLNDCKNHFEAAVKIMNRLEKIGEM